MRLLIRCGDLERDDDGVSRRRDRRGVTDFRRGSGERLLSRLRLVERLLLEIDRRRRRLVERERLLCDLRVEVDLLRSDDRRLVGCCLGVGDRRRLGVGERFLRGVIERLRTIRRAGVGDRFRDADRLRSDRLTDRFRSDRLTDLDRSRSDRLTDFDRFRSDRLTDFDLFRETDRLDLCSGLILR